jgi:hypothetical protein
VHTSQSAPHLPKRRAVRAKPNNLECKSGITRTSRVWHAGSAHGQATVRNFDIQISRGKDCCIHQRCLVALRLTMDNITQRLACRAPSTALQATTCVNSQKTPLVPHCNRWMQGARAGLTDPCPPCSVCLAGCTLPSMPYLPLLACQGRWPQPQPERALVHPLTAAPSAAAPPRPAAAAARACLPSSSV